jgi:hypothetical protein
MKYLSSARLQKVLNRNDCADINAFETAKRLLHERLDEGLPVDTYGVIIQNDDGTKSVDMSPKLVNILLDYITAPKKVRLCVDAFFDLGEPVYIGVSFNVKRIENYILGRDRVCARQILVEACHVRKKNLDKRKSAVINQIMDRMPNWHRAKSPMRIDGYGLQRTFVRDGYEREQEDKLYKALGYDEAEIEISDDVRAKKILGDLW